MFAICYSVSCVKYVYNLFCYNVVLLRIPQVSVSDISWTQWKRCVYCVRLRMTMTPNQLLEFALSPPHSRTGSLTHICECTLILPERMCMRRCYSYTNTQHISNKPMAVSSICCVSEVNTSHLLEIFSFNDHEKIAFSLDISRCLAIILYFVNSFNHFGVVCRS